MDLKTFLDATTVGDWIDNLIELLQQTNGVD